MAARKRGVVHVNLPYRKPLEPENEAADEPKIDRCAPAHVDGNRKTLALGLAPLLSADVLRRKGIIYFGHGSCRSEAERERMLPWAAELSRVSGFPILAEFTSNMRAANIALAPMQSFSECPAAPGLRAQCCQF